MGHAARFGHAFAKSQLAAGTPLPLEGSVLISANHIANRKLLATTNITTAPNARSLPWLHASTAGSDHFASVRPATARLRTETTKPITREAIRAVSSARRIRREIQNPFTPSVMSMPSMNNRPSDAAERQPPNFSAVSANSSA